MPEGAGFGLDRTRGELHRVSTHNDWLLIRENQDRINLPENDRRELEAFDRVTDIDQIRLIGVRHGLVRIRDHRNRISGPARRCWRRRKTFRDNRTSISAGLKPFTSRQITLPQFRDWCKIACMSLSQGSRRRGLPSEAKPARALSGRQLKYSSRPRDGNGPKANTIWTDSVFKSQSDQSTPALRQLPALVEAKWLRRLVNTG
jgi:hypothetical protein